MDFHNHHHPPQQQQQPPHSDFLGMTAAPSPPVSGNFNTMYNNTISFQQQQQQQQARPMQTNKSAGSFDSFGNTTSNGNGGAFGGLGTPWKT
jgi:hypothetical protein